MAHVSTYHVSQKLLKIAARNVSKIRFVASTSPGDEGRGRKVRYRSLFRAGPWAAVVLISRVRRGWREGEKEREREREKEMERGTRDVSCVSRAKMQGKVSRAKVVTYWLCQTPPIFLNDLASKNPTFLGTLLLVLSSRLSSSSSRILSFDFRFSLSPPLSLSFSFFCWRILRELDLRESLSESGDFINTLLILIDMFFCGIHRFFRIRLRAYVKIRDFYKHIRVSGDVNCTKVLSNARSRKYYIVDVQNYIIIRIIL